MKQFDLFEKLITNKPLVEVKEKIEHQIQYTEFQLDVDNHSLVVNIPVRESQNFEADLQQIKEPLTIDLLKPLLRKFRGIRG